jgi:hypothetical protein
LLSGVEGTQSTDLRDDLSPLSCHEDFLFCLSCPLVGLLCHISESAFESQESYVSLLTQLSMFSFNIDSWCMKELLEVNSLLAVPHLPKSVSTIRDWECLWMVRLVCLTIVQIFIPTSLATCSLMLIVTWIRSYEALTLNENNYLDDVRGKTIIILSGLISQKWWCFVTSKCLVLWVIIFGLSVVHNQIVLWRHNVILFICSTLRFCVYRRSQWNTTFWDIVSSSILLATWDLSQWISVSIFYKRHNSWALTFQSRSSIFIFQD